MPPPKWSLNPPEVPFGSEWIYSAFWDLHTCRQFGWGASPIPWTAMRDYFIGFEWDGDDFEDFAALITVMDQEYLAYTSEVNKT